MNKKLLAVTKTFNERGFTYTQDCLTGEIISKKPLFHVVEKEPVIEQPKEKQIEIPQFFLRWQRDRDFAAKKNN